MRLYLAAATWVVSLMAGLVASSTNTPNTPTPLPDHLVLPPFPSTYNLSKSTAIQTCASSPHDSLDYIRDWGIVSYDWSNLNSIWHNDHPMDSDQKLVDSAARARKAAPDTKIWIYRNLVIAYAEFTQAVIFIFSFFCFSRPHYSKTFLWR